MQYHAQWPHRYRRGVKLAMADFDYHTCTIVIFILIFLPNDTNNVILFDQIFSDTPTLTLAPIVMMTPKTTTQL